MSWPRDMSQDMRAEELSVRAEAMSDEAEIAQARKEEFWFQAMTAGKGADKVSDEAYMRMAEAAGKMLPNHFCAGTTSVLNQRCITRAYIFSLKE
jgi:hypothetical protein